MANGQQEIHEITEEEGEKKYEEHKDTAVFFYDPDYLHDFAKVCGKGEKILLFSDKGFRLYDRSGKLLCEEKLSDSKEVK